MAIAPNTSLALGSADSPALVPIDVRLVIVEILIPNTLHLTEVGVSGSLSMNLRRPLCRPAAP